jgi:hypothetical protein
VLAWAIDHELAEDGADRGNRCAASYSHGGNVTRAESAFRAALSPGTLARSRLGPFELHDQLRSCGKPGLCEVDITFDHSNISEANEITGSQSGSQRQQIPGYPRPLPATISAAREHIRPHLAPSGDRPKVPSKQRAGGSSPSRRTNRTRSEPCSDLESYGREPHGEPPEHLSAVAAIPPAW